jgi:hypothetical protein
MILRPRSRTSHQIACAIATLILLAGCSSGDRDQARKPAPANTEARRDSLIAASRLPGAAAVGKALAVADSARARADRANGGSP